MRGNGERFVWHARCACVTVNLHFPLAALPASSFLFFLIAREKESCVIRRERDAEGKAGWRHTPCIILRVRAGRFCVLPALINARVEVYTYRIRWVLICECFEKGKERRQDVCHARFFRNFNKVLNNNVISRIFYTVKWNDVIFSLVFLVFFRDCCIVYQINNLYHNRMLKQKLFYH